MDKQSSENHIKVLKKFRDVCSSQLDIGALTELDDAIEALKKALDHRQNETDALAQTDRVLQVLAKAVTLVTNLSDFM
jgi:hypothetical protein